MSQGVTKEFAFRVKLIFIDYIFKNNIKDLKKKKNPQTFFLQKKWYYFYYLLLKIALWPLGEQFKSNSFIANYLSQLWQMKTVTTKRNKSLVNFI